MKYAHLVKLTVFSYQNEDDENILDALIKLFPFDLKENKILVKEKSTEGFNDSKIRIREISITKTNLVNQFLKNLLEKLNKEQKEKIIQQMASRLDENLDFFVRFSKAEWIENNKLILTDTGKCYHLKISVAAFPKKREIALNLIKDLFEKL